MPPHNIFDSDCEQGAGMGQLFNSLLSNSISALAPMCNDSPGPRVYSPTYPMNHEPSPAAASNADGTSPRGKVTPSRPLTSPHSVSTSTSPDPRRPPLNPVKPKPSSIRSRRRVGLSITVPPPPSDPHQSPSPSYSPYGEDNPPPRISCSRNVDLRRKSLSERHFFRPVSDDSEDSHMGMNQ
mmetsp:Transcript_39501/g.94965  ORF Transcript_39501/g.94965 Transcript_39501/m.94965 type:complete len:182 (+) Transcript_39501:336-881(+)